MLHKGRHFTVASGLRVMTAVASLPENRAPRTRNRSRDRTLRLSGGCSLTTWARWRPLHNFPTLCM